MPWLCFRGKGRGGGALRFRAARFLKTPQTAALPEQSALGDYGAGLRYRSPTPRLWQAPASTYKTKKKGKVRYGLLAQGCTAGGFVCDCAMGARALLYPRPRAPANSRPGFPIWVVWCCSLAGACQWHGLLAWREFRFFAPHAQPGRRRSTTLSCCARLSAAGRAGCQLIRPCQWWLMT